MGDEVFGLAPSERAELEVLIAPVDSTRPLAPTVWQPFPDGLSRTTLIRQPGSSSIVSWYGTLPLKKLKSGSWMLAVRVKDQQGRQAQQEGRLTVVLP